MVSTQLWPKCVAANFYIRKCIPSSLHQTLYAIATATALAHPHFYFYCYYYYFIYIVYISVDYIEHAKALYISQCWQSFGKIPIGDIKWCSHATATDTQPGNNRSTLLACVFFSLWSLGRFAFISEVAHFCCFQWFIGSLINCIV